MRTTLPGLLLAGLSLLSMAASAQPDDAAPWDLARMGRTIDAARLAHRQGDAIGAEKLCHDAFESVERSALAAYDAYADRLRTEHRAEEAAVREQAGKLHALKAEQARATQPTSTYLGFAPADGLRAYADLLATVGQPDDAERMRSLALAYQQVQQSHFQRTQMFRQGQDPRGSC